MGSSSADPTSTSQPLPPKQRDSDATRFLLAGTSAMCAACITNPIDVIKVRMQLDNELSAQREGGVRTAMGERYYRGMLRGAGRIVAEEGVAGLYKGLLPSLMRESSYTTIRLGAYEPLKRFLGAKDVSHTPLWQKLVAGATSGAIGSSIATPTDLVKVRYQSHGLRDPPLPYRNAFHAFYVIYSREGGIRSLYRGIGPTVQRAAVLTATQIPTYDHTKHTLLNAGLMTEGPYLHVVCSMWAGLVCALTTSPIDVVKTRYMKQRKGTHSAVVYKSGFHCFVKTVQSEGLFGLYKGFVPNWARIGPHTLITFFIFEQLRRISGMNPV